jgi:hypothetical protein
LHSRMPLPHSPRTTFSSGCAHRTTPIGRNEDCSTSCFAGLEFQSPSSRCASSGLDEEEQPRGPVWSLLLCAKRRSEFKGSFFAAAAGDASSLPSYECPAGWSGHLQTSETALRLGSARWSARWSRQAQPRIRALPAAMPAADGIRRFPHVHAVCGGQVKRDRIRTCDLWFRRP